MTGLYLIWFGNDWNANSWESKPGESLKEALIAAADWQDKYDAGRKQMTDVIYLADDKEVVLSEARRNAAVRYYESLFPEDGYYERNFTRPSSAPIYNV